MWHNATRRARQAAAVPLTCVALVLQASGNGNTARQLWPAAALSPRVRSLARRFEQLGCRAVFLVMSGRRVIALRITGGVGCADE